MTQVVKPDEWIDELGMSGATVNAILDCVMADVAENIVQKICPLHAWRRNDADPKAAYVQRLEYGQA